MRRNSAKTVPTDWVRTCATARHQSVRRILTLDTTLYIWARIPQRFSILRNLETRKCDSKIEKLKNHRGRKLELSPKNMLWFKVPQEHKIGLEKLLWIKKQEK